MHVRKRECNIACNRCDRNSAEEHVKESETESKEEHKENKGKREETKHGNSLPEKKTQKLPSMAYYYLQYYLEQKAF